MSNFEIIKKYGIIWKFLEFFMLKEELITLVCNNQFHLVEEGLKAFSVDDIMDRDAEGNSLLHYLSKSSNLSAVNIALYLIKEGLDSNDVNKYFQSAKDIAVSSNNRILMHFYKNI